jgi:hypothetical protein
MEPIYAQNSYDTPEDNKRVFIDQLFLGTNIYFMYSFIKQVLDTTSLSKKGFYTPKKNGKNHLLEQLKI